MSDEWLERLVPFFEAAEYAQRIVNRMPSESSEDRRARAEKWLAIMDEWHKSQIRWHLTNTPSR